MKFPGLPTISALMFAGMMAAWLGLWGPLSLEKLREWQTLLAAFIALGAGTLAYRGAMAKVDFDREVHYRTIARQHLGLKLRLSHSLTVVFDEANAVIRNVEPLPPFTASPRSLTRSDISVERSGDEIEEAWKVLESMPRSVVLPLVTIRYDIMHLNGRVLADFPERFEINYQNQFDDKFRTVRNLAEAIRTHASEAVTSIRADVNAP